MNLSYVPDENITRTIRRVESRFLSSLLTDQHDIESFPQAYGNRIRSTTPLNQIAWQKFIKSSHIRRSNRVLSEQEIVSDYGDNYGIDSFDYSASCLIRGSDVTASSKKHFDGVSNSNSRPVIVP